MALKIIIKPEHMIVTHLFRDAVFFLEQGNKLFAEDQHKARTYVRASIITSLAALEALVNTLLYLLDDAGDLDVAETAFVQEKRVELTEEGHFEVRGRQFRSLEQKVKFLYWRTEGVPISMKEKKLWESFLNATRLRNKIVHPRPGEVSYSTQTIMAAESCLKATRTIAEMFGWHDY